MSLIQSTPQEIIRRERLNFFFTKQKKYKDLSMKFLVILYSISLYTLYLNVKVSIVELNFHLKNEVKSSVFIYNVNEFLQSQLRYILSVFLFTFDIFDKFLNYFSR